MIKPTRAISITAFVFATCSTGLPQRDELEVRLSDPLAPGNATTPEVANGIGLPWEENKLQSVAEKERETWCTQHTSICNNLCIANANGVKTSTCDKSNLSWRCQCTDGTSPDLTKFDFTVPFFQCQWELTNCVRQCPTGNQECQNECEGKFDCGVYKGTPVDPVVEEKPADEGEQEVAPRLSRASSIETSMFAVVSLAMSCLQLIK
eukprot:TRINITY_DN64029_c0_g1_i1.p1 TRINITY_DN64029_c0_g1~~TRINITY_DN64029_c0_g1_i1.p1  ORF type:complete len:207 (+),score=6.57 TRINITY_DN64029_c0_g1_i1:36-656(+)